MKKLIVPWLALALVLAAGLAGAAQVDGEKLVRNLWQFFANRQMAKLEAMTSPAFQSVHSFGAYGKAQEMNLLKNLKLGQYQLSDFKTTQQGPVVIVTYMVRAAETIKGERLGGRPAPRMTIFVQTKAGWQWLAHANLKPVK